MKRLSLAVLAVLVACGVARAGQDHHDQSQPQSPPASDQQQKPPTLGKNPDDTQRPTLGTAPSLKGPHTYNTTDPRKLLRIHTIYIEPIDDNLNEKLADDIAKEGPFRIVASAKEADAILRGTCLDSARLRHVHSEVFLMGRNGESIWQDVVRRPYRPPTLAKALEDTAAAVVADLRASIREAEAR
jgi:hypothetical protein